MTTPGRVVGFDLTVENAPAIRDFYAAVIGWQAEGLDMGGYDDYFMKTTDGDTVAGVCHARGDQTDLPSQWLAYISVSDLSASMKRCESMGGRVIAGPKGNGPGAYCVIQDPAGAVLAIMETPEEE